MRQPELGNRLLELRKQKNLTQEELALKSYVSVRTIQRIEAGEVLPRTSTIKILITAMGENFESFYDSFSAPAEEKKSTAKKPAILVISFIAGMVYLLSLPALAIFDYYWLFDSGKIDVTMHMAYATTTIVMMLSYTFFAGGFYYLGNLFENSLLKSITLMLIISNFGIGILDIVSFGAQSKDLFALPYIGASVIFGAMSIVFGVALIRLQDGMGELSRIAGILEIVIGCLLLTVILFPLAFIIMFPAVVLEIVLLYRGYEYLAKGR